MNAEAKSGKDLAPRQLLAAFTGGRIVYWLAVAVFIHVAVIGALSLGYIRDRWLDPDGAARRKAEADANAAAGGTNAVAGKTNAVAPAAADNTNAVASAAADGTNAPAAASNAVVIAKTADEPSDVMGIPAGLTNSAIYKRVTAVAKPEDMPSLDKDSGIPLDDTSVR